MKLKTFNKVLGASVVMSAMLIGQQAWAEAGDLINNIATIGYSVDGVDQTDIESSPEGNSVPGASQGSQTQFVEDQIINFAVVTNDADSIPVAPGSTAQTLSFTVYNIADGASSTVTNPGSNGTITVSLSANDLLTGTANPQTTGDASDIFDTVAACVLSTTSVTLTPGGSAPVLVTCDIPAEIGGQDGGGNLVEENIAALNLVGVVSEGYDGTSTVSITNTSNTTVNDMMTVQFVFADANAGDAEGDNALYNGGHSDQSAYRIIKPSLRVTKTATVISDPVCTADPSCTDPKAIPGAIIEYTIAVGNTGSTTAEAVIISDVVQDVDVGSPTVTSITNTGGAAGGTTETATLVQGDCGDIASNETCTLVFEVEVKYD